MKFFIILFLITVLSGCATADYAQTSDSITTGIALSNGFAEANPIFANAGWPVIAIAKFGITQGVKQLPFQYCQPGLFGLTISGFGAALWNVGVLAGSGPASLPVIVGVFYWQWDNWKRDSIMDCIKKPSEIMIFESTTGWDK